MNIAILTAVWNRPLTTRIFWEGAARLQRQWPHHSVGIYAGGDQDVHRALAKEYGGTWVETPNAPLGAKWSNVSEAAWRDGADFVIIMGSDDVMTDPLGYKYIEAIQTGAEYVGLRSCFMAEPRSQRALQLVGHSSKRRWAEVIGAGRGFNRRILDDMKGRLWPDKASRGLDWRMTMALQMKGVKDGADVIIPGNGSASLIDVKTDNMWSFDRVAVNTHAVMKADYEATVQMLPAPELALIRQLETGHCPTCLRATLT